VEVIGMDRIATLAIFLSLLVFGSGAQAADKNPPVVYSDRAVDQAIEKGIAYLWSQQAPDGSWGAVPEGPKNKGETNVGATAICAYALLENGISPQDKRLAKALDFLSKTPGESTYGIGLRACAWEAATRYDPKFRRYLAADVRLLVNSISRQGRYGYLSRGQTPAANASWSNSRTQYGNLGVWVGARGDVEVPTGYWQLAMNHWIKDQKSDGGWGYNREHDDYSHISMTLAGVASLYVCLDNLYAARFANCRANTEIPALDKGMAWLEKNFLDAFKSGGRNWLLYSLYGIERVALASGYKYFGEHDWYKLGATKLLGLQAKNGSWVDPYSMKLFGPHVSTGYALLFLVRGRHTVVFNKLQYDGDWNNRPRDMATLTRWLSRTFEATLNWQIINLKVPVSEWHDAPILYLAGDETPKFTDEQIDKLRQYVLQGGTLFSVSECSGHGFRKGIRELYQKLFPEYPLTAIPPDHPLYSVHFKIPGRPAMFVASNGIRPLVVHVDDDLARHWQLDLSATQKNSFETAANLVMYITDKRFRHRGVSPWPEKPSVKPERTVKLTVVQHEGNCNPEPLAHERFARLLLKNTKTALEISGPVPADQLPGGAASVAVLTGTRAFALPAQQKAALKAFVEGGGLLVVSAAGGSAGEAKDFDASARKLLDELFGADKLRALATTSPLFQIKGMEIESVKYRPMTRRKLGGMKGPNLRAVMADDGRILVLYSSEDLTAGLVGYPAYGVDGYDPGEGDEGGSAYEIMRNIVLFAAKPAKG